MGCLWLSVVFACGFSTVHSTALDDYVNKYDPTYTYKEIGTPFKGDGFTSYFINMTSQTWLSGKQHRCGKKVTVDYLRACMCVCVRVRAASEVSQSVWWHYLVINIPDKVQFSDTGLVYLTGGNNHDGYAISLPRL